MDVAAIMPCRGRAEQTVVNVRRLLATASRGKWHLLCVAGRDDVQLLASVNEIDDWRVATATDLLRERFSYWEALTYATERTDAPLLINLANDLWACDDWLKIAVEEYLRRFNNGHGLLGFAGDAHPPQHSCHFLISRRLLDRYGGWPVWYAHNFGDTELCQRAQADGVYAKSERAWLEHCHPMLGQGQDDEVYQAGRATFEQDRALFVERRRLGWPRIGSASSGVSTSSGAATGSAR